MLHNVCTVSSNGQTFVFSSLLEMEAGVNALIVLVCAVQIYQNPSKSKDHNNAGSLLWTLTTR